ncbi:uncharacterized protein LOC112043164 [Bicyclus anynana]|uniref:Uncharacterized protein LOC112043164 n=1 Tax=Bicyclus anynana TaxID=110368 RepID=A0A6J1MIQ5_BICAN|nr:uncharacterized protein LOC112043164 [Bicyclus anynana]
MIDHVYNEKSIDRIIKQNYQLEAEKIRNKHSQDLNHFIDWFENQPGHLKHVLQRLDKLRQEQVEPIVEIVAGVLSEHPKLEMLYNEKLNKTSELEKKLKRYKIICKLNCEDDEENDYIISKREIGEDFYCSSLEDLHKHITKNLDQFVIKINNITMNKLSSTDKIYEEIIEEIKSNLKDKALNEFGRTMYDILHLEDEYHHFVDNITSVDLFAAVYAIKSFGLHIDTKLLELEQAIEKYGKHCNSCSSKSLVRKARQANPELDTKQTAEQPSLVDGLLENKFKEIVDAVERDCKNIFNDLNVLIQNIDQVSGENWKPLQDELHAMTTAEREVLESLQNLASTKPIDILLEIIKKLQALLQFIYDILNNLP